MARRDAVLKVFLVLVLLCCLGALAYDLWMFHRDYPSGWMPL